MNDSPEPEERKQDPHATVPDKQGSVVPLGWHPTPSKPVPVVRCIQIKKDGFRCKRWSLRGYTKCRHHAGPGIMKDGNVARYAEAVIEAARLRLVDDTDKALDVLQELIGPGSSEGIRLKAATEVLDRAGVRGGFDIKVEGTVTVENPSDEIAARLKSLQESAKTVSEMRDKARREAAEAGDDPDQIIDAEVIDEQETLF